MRNPRKQHMAKGRRMWPTAFSAAWRSANDGFPHLLGLTTRVPGDLSQSKLIIVVDAKARQQRAKESRSDYHKGEGWSRSWQDFALRRVWSQGRD